MRYPVHTPLYSGTQLQVEIPGLLSRPRVWFHDQPAHRLFSNKHVFTFKDEADVQHELKISLPLFDPVIRVTLDNQTHALNKTHSLKARSAIFVPLAAMAFCLVLNTLPLVLAVLLTLPLSILAVRAMRLNHFSQVRKAMLVAAMLIPLSLFGYSAGLLLGGNAFKSEPQGAQISHVFYEVLITSDAFADASRQDVVDLLEAFRTTQPFETMELELAELPIAPQLEVSITQQLNPKLQRDVWSVRFDFTTAEIGVNDSQVLADALGTRFERFLIALEEQ